MLPWANDLQDRLTRIADSLTWLDGDDAESPWHLGPGITALSHWAVVGLEWDFTVFVLLKIEGVPEESNDPMGNEYPLFQKLLFDRITIVDFFYDLPGLGGSVFDCLVDILESRFCGWDRFVVSKIPHTPVAMTIRKYLRFSSVSRGNCIIIRPWRYWWICLGRTLWIAVDGCSVSWVRIFHFAKPHPVLNQSWEQGIYIYWMNVWMFAGLWPPGHWWGTSAPGQYHQEYLVNFGGSADSNCNRTCVSHQIQHEGRQQILHRKTSYLLI